MRAVSLASSQHCRSVNTDTQCKGAFTATVAKSKGTFTGQLRRYLHTFVTVLILERHLQLTTHIPNNDLFTFAETDRDTDSDSTPNDYIVPCKHFHIPWSQIQISIPTVNYRNGNPESNSGSESVSDNVI